MFLGGELFVPDGLYGIEAGSFLGGEVAKANTDGDADGKTDDNAPHGDYSGIAYDGVAAPCEQCPEEYSQDTSCEADEDTFDEELVADVQTSRAHAHAQTYFFGTLSDADEHDVHDADTGNEK